MQIRFWTTFVRSNVLIGYKDALSAIDLAKNKIMSKEDEFTFF